MIFSRTLACDCVGIVWCLRRWLHPFFVYLERPLFLTTVVGIGMYAFDRVVSMAAFSLLGLNDAASVEKKECCWARYLYRLVRWVTNVLVMFLGISPLFSVYDVVNGFRTTVSLFQHPLL